MNVRRRGFTLIELLVVIAIIAILAAILFPVFARARERARQTSCLSNIKQITLGALMYAQDFGEAVPESLDADMNSYWHEKIMPYVMNEQIFTCPSTRSTSLTWSNFNYGLVNQTSGYRGGARAFTLPDGTRIDGRPTPIYLPEIELPAETAYVSDAENFVTDIAFWTHGGSPYDEHGGAWYYVDGRHNGGANVGFYDGHARWLTSTSPFGAEFPNVCAGPLEYWYIRSTR